MIVGMAGHVDHGKTALVRALTGVDTDRLKEEKARGITIDLGFAYARFASERITGIVDVPGHERFVHTMLAGAGGIDYALLAIAADDGIKPQTLEHLAILDLLGVTRGIVALTKADLAADERRETVTRDIRAMLAPTALGAAAVLPVSIITGEGIDLLKQVLALAETETAARAGGRFRLAVDRCFSLPGAGTVVTGTVLCGAVTVGDQVTVSPVGLAARVRSIHAQNQPAASGIAGERCALNLAGEGISKDAVSRGDMVVDPVLHAPAERIDASLFVLSGEPKPIGDWFPARFHHCSAETGVHIVPLERPITPGTTAKVQLVLERAIAAAVGDRFILRDVSAQRTIGGGRLLDLRAPPRKRRSPERLAFLDSAGRTKATEALTALLATAPFLVDLDAFARDRALSRVELQEAIDSAPAEMVAGTPSRLALSPTQRRTFSETLGRTLSTFHADNPDLQGIGRERLRLQTTPRLPPPAFLAVLRAEHGAGRLVLEGAFVRLPGHAVQLTEAEEKLYALLRPHLEGEGRFRPPRVRDFVDMLGLDERDVRRVLKLSARLGRLDEIRHDHFFTRTTTAEMVQIIADVAAHAECGAFSAGLFRDRVNNGRKVAIEILEFFDRQGLTFRRGDLRRVNPHRLDLYRESVPDTEEGRESSPVGRPDFKSGWGSGAVSGGFDSHSLPPADEAT